MEAGNPGALPPDLPIRALYRRHTSPPRNPQLAGAVFRTRLIEQWSTRTLRIVDACRPHGIAVEFEQDMGMFIVRLRKAPTERTAPEVVPEVTGEVTEKPKSRLQEYPKIVFRRGACAVFASVGTIRRRRAAPAGDGP